MSALNDDQEESSVLEKIAPFLHRSNNPNQRAGASKADSRYWMVGKRLALHDSANYSIQLSKQGQRAWFPLGTPNKKSAAAKASEIYSFMQAHGWQATLDRYKPKAASKVEVVTVGMLITKACNISSARRESLDAYTKAFRRIVSEIKGIKSNRKHDYHGGGVAEWQGMVDAVSLDSITPVEVMAWKNRRLRNAESDPLAKRRAIVTVNSLIRNSKALFGKKILPFVEQAITLPRPLPFEGVTMEKPPSMRYVSKMDPYAILASAREELAEAKPEAFKVLVLALVCGLRRSEIDNLLWRAFDFSNSILRVEASEYHQLKSEDSAGEIDLDADTLALFRSFRTKNPTSSFVIESPNRPRSQMKTRCYRCNAVFEQVLAWLRGKGVETTKPLHTLRKEIGSVIASEHGIFEASRYLRHSDIRITSAIYADKKKAVTPKAFAGLLAANASVQVVD